MRLELLEVDANGSGMPMTPAANNAESDVDEAAAAAAGEPELKSDFVTKTSLFSAEVIGLLAHAALPKLCTVFPRTAAVVLLC